jgi:hypothetical protein
MLGTKYNFQQGVLYTMALAINLISTLDILYDKNLVI